MYQRWRQEARNKRHNKCKYIRRTLCAIQVHFWRMHTPGRIRFSIPYFYGNRTGHSPRYFLQSLRKYLVIRYVAYMYGMYVVYIYIYIFDTYPYVEITRDICSRALLASCENWSLETRLKLKLRDSFRESNDINGEIITREVIRIQ